MTNAPASRRHMVRRASEYADRLERSLRGTSLAVLKSPVLKPRVVMEAPITNAAVDYVGLGFGDLAARSLPFVYVRSSYLRTVWMEPGDAQLLAALSSASGMEGSLADTVPFRAKAKLDNEELELSGARAGPLWAATGTAEPVTPVSWIKITVVSRFVSAQDVRLSLSVDPRPYIDELRDNVTRSMTSLRGARELRQLAKSRSRALREIESKSLDDLSGLVAFSLISEVSPQPSTPFDAPTPVGLPELWHAAVARVDADRPTSAEDAISADSLLDSLIDAFRRNEFIRDIALAMRAVGEALRYLAGDFKVPSAGCHRAWQRWRQAVDGAATTAFGLPGSPRRVAAHAPSSEEFEQASAGVERAEQQWMAKWGDWIGTHDAAVDG